VISNGRRTVSTAALTALLVLLILPAGASAATPSGLVGQTVTQVNSTVQSTGATVSQVGAQVDGTVARTVEGVRQALGGPADPARSVPTPDVEVGKTLDETVTKPAVDAVKNVTAPDEPAQAQSPDAPPPSTRSRGEHRSRGAADQRAGGGHTAAPTRSPSTVGASGAEAALEHPAAGPVSSAPRDLPAASDEPPPGSTPDGPAFGALGGGAIASAAFSAGALAILLTALFLAASALRTRLPRLGEVGRPLPLVFALERPG
jgi:hypothetical protein